MKKALKLFAAVVLLAVIGVPTVLLADSPEPPCSTCKPLTIVQK